MSPEAGAVAEAASEHPGAGGRAPSAVAFFDVDETLLSVRTLESFLMYYRAAHPGWLSDDVLHDLRREVEHADRAQFNALYYTLWTGQSVAEVARFGEAWFAEQAARPGFFRPNVLEKLNDHRSRGAAIVLVSGSFEAPLAPLARQIHADALCCTQLDESGGQYSGAIAAAMIGDDKRRAVSSYLARFDPPPPSWAYGDHLSDLGMLEAVSNPVVVGPDVGLGALARTRHWPILAIDTPLAPGRGPR